MKRLLAIAVVALALMPGLFDPRLERGVGTALEQRGADDQPNNTRAERHEHEPSRRGQNSLLPSAHGGDQRRSGQQEHKKCASEEDACSKMNRQGGEQHRGHSTRNVKRPSVMCQSTESTRQITVYVPGASGGSVTRMSRGLERSTWPSSWSTRAPWPSSIRTVL